MNHKLFSKMTRKELNRELDACSWRNGSGYGDPRIAETTLQIVLSELDRRSNRNTQYLTSIGAAVIGAVLGSLMTFLLTKH